MNIIQIHNRYQKAGGEDYVVEAERILLKENGHHVFQVITDNHSILKVFKKRKDFYYQINKILKNQKIDIAHIHNTFHVIGSGIYKKLAEHKIPIIQTLHNYRLLCPNGLLFDGYNQVCEKCAGGHFIHSVIKKCYQKSYFKSLLMAYLVKRWKENVSQYVGVFVALTDFSKNKFTSYLNIKNIVVKPNFIFDQQDNSGIEYQNYALYLGRISIEKDIETILKGFEKLKYPIIIAGDGEILEHFKTQFKAIKNIRFVGYIKDSAKEKLIKESSFLVFASKCYENFPVSILEAFKYRKAVVASNIGCIPSIVKENETGILYEPQNEESLLQAVGKMLESINYIRIGENAYNNFINYYSEVQNYIQIIHIYERTIEKKCE